MNAARRLRSKDFPRSPEDQGEKIYVYDGLVGYRVNNGCEEVRVLWPRQYAWEPASEFPKEEEDRAKKRRGRAGITSGKMKEKKGSLKRKEGHIRVR
jgi:hypothetical protein